MNIEEFNQAMEEESRGMKIPSSLDELGRSQMPIERVRNNMQTEIGIQFLTFLIYYAVLVVIPLDPFPKGLYVFCIFLAALMTAGYLAKMIWFLRKTQAISTYTRDTILTFIHDLKLSLEVYKTAIIAGSLLLPPAVLALWMNVGGKAELLYKWFTLDIPGEQILLLLGGYLVLGLLFYAVTIWWSHVLYGKHIVQLEDLLDEYEEV